METTTKTLDKTAWYIISVSSGYERKVKEALENRIVNDGLEETISDVFLPEAEITTKTGKKKTKNIWPGYMFIKMEMTDDAWFIVRNTTYVTGFLGSSGKGAKPFPADRRKIRKMINQLSKEVAAEKAQDTKEAKAPISIDFIIGDMVEVIAGLHIGKFSKVKDIDFDKEEITIEVEMFGRINPAQVKISDVVRTAANK